MDCPSRMPNIAVLNGEAHKDIRIKTDSAAHLGDAVRFVPVVLPEFTNLILHYPLFFSKDADTGAFYCGAMMGFDEEENLFLGKRAPLDIYRPLNLQRGPFFTAGNELAIDLDHPRISRMEGQPLFGPDGSASPYLDSIVGTMRALTTGATATRAFIDTLLQHKLIEPIAIDVAFDDGTRRDVVGLYTISQDTLQQLDDAVVTDLFRRGYLKLIYLMMASVRHVNGLAQMKNRALLDLG
ncbi:SapC family protein [Novosphingobium sp.]|uniref:SapC family protein n=1 Tax=Novosphingobium sp. TaxID=1874826 RepID=UPI003B52852A